MSTGLTVGLTTVLNMKMVTSSHITDEVTYGVVVVYNQKH